MREPRKSRKATEEFLTFLSHGDQIKIKDIEFDVVLRSFDEDPEVFQKKWLWPLLAEGLNLDCACELVIHSILRPN